MKKIISVVITFILCMQFSNISAEEYEKMNQGRIYINNTLVESPDTVLFDEDSFLMPFRTVLEGIGATVEWDEKTENVTFYYDGNKYSCYTEIREPYLGMALYIKCPIKKFAPLSGHLQLNPMSGSGWCYMINDRIYLTEETLTWLLKDIDCDLEIDDINHVFKITAKQTKHTP